MKSVDTNILIRVFTKDDPVQTPLAADAFRKPAFVSHGVIRETEWVLRSNYGWPRAEIANALRGLLNVETVTIPDRELIAWSLDRYAAGADFTDMLHLIASRDLDAFLTFDMGMAGAAGPAAPVRIERLS